MKLNKIGGTDMQINSGISAYQSITTPVNSAKKAKEDDIKTDGSSKVLANPSVKAPDQDTITLSGKNEKLSAEALDKIHAHQTESFNTMLSSMLGKQIESSTIMNNAQAILIKAGMGDITAEEAAHNISEDGAYGVNAMATNLFDMAEALSGGDPDKMEIMREAVTDGFVAAGMELGVGDKVSNLPQVSQDTFTEIMQRFDHFSENGSLDSYEYVPY